MHQNVTTIINFPHNYKLLSDLLSTFYASFWECVQWKDWIKCCRLYFDQHTGGHKETVGSREGGGKINVSLAADTVWSFVNCEQAIRQLVTLQGGRNETLVMTNTNEIPTGDVTCGAQIYIENSTSLLDVGGSTLSQTHFLAECHANTSQHYTGCYTAAGTGSRRVAEAQTRTLPYALLRWTLLC